MSDTFGNRPVDLGTLAYHPILAQRDGDILLKELATNLAPCLAEGIRREFEKLTGLDLRHPEYQTRAGDVVSIAPGIRGEVEDIEQKQLAEELQSLHDLLAAWAGSLEDSLIAEDEQTPQDWDKRTPSEKISHLLDRIPKMVEDLKTSKKALEQIPEMEKAAADLAACQLELQAAKQQTLAAEAQIVRLKAEKDVLSSENTGNLYDLDTCREEVRYTRELLGEAEARIYNLQALRATDAERLTFLYNQILPTGWENRPDPWAEIQAIFSPEF